MQAKPKPKPIPDPERVLCLSSARVSQPSSVTFSRKRIYCNARAARAAFALKRISRQLQRLPQLALVYVVIILNPTEFSSRDLRGRGIFVNFTCLEELSKACCVFCTHTHTEKGKLLKQRKTKAQKTLSKVSQVDFKDCG